MLNVYEANLVRACPEDGATIAYSITLTSKKTEMVEEIIQVLDSVDKSILQESLAEYIKSQMPDCVVQVVGTHSGITITTTM
tara:strand:+ start:1135 stop:1380 length:246 start_codon:yes stop_codon:yes gene_type:complete